MSAIAKPDFNVCGEFLDERGALPVGRRAALRALLPSSVPDAQAEAFLNRCSVGAVAVAEAWPEEPPLKAMRDDLDAFANHAGRLLRDLRDMGPAGRAYLDSRLHALLLASSPDVQVPRLRRALDALAGFSGSEGGDEDGDEQLAASSLWDLIAEIEAAGRYAAGRVHVNRQFRPAIERARHLVRVAALAHRSVFGEAPAINHRSDWFSGFVAAFGEALGAKPGGDLIEQGVRDART